MTVPRVSALISARLRRKRLILCQSISTGVLLPRQIPSASDGDTIYALSTAPGRAAIAVIRISGSACLTVYERLCPSRTHPKPRVATLRRLYDPDVTSQILDTGALILYFPAPATATGEDILELHCHGGPAIVRSVLEAIARCSSNSSSHGAIRHAEAGEFTKRAFYNDRLDLASVEALSDSLSAETEQQRRLAVSGASTGLTHRYEAWRSLLLYARGELEALIDFSEDQYFEESPIEFVQSVNQQIQHLKTQIKMHILNGSRGELLRSGIDVALLGPPNAGKSSLLNRLVRREAAIVSHEAGTTRDIVDVTVDIGGWLVRFGDMAGLRADKASLEAPTSTTTMHVTDRVGEIEREGIRRARERAMQADLVVVLISLQLSAVGSVELAINSELVDAVQECHTAGKQMLFAINKIDLLHKQCRGHMVTISRLLTRLLETFSAIDPNEVFLLSCVDADLATLDDLDAGGFQTFVAGLTAKFSAMTTAAVGQDRSNVTPELTASEAQAYWTASLSVTHRQSQHLQSCLKHLDSFLELTCVTTVAPESEPTSTRARSQRHENTGPQPPGQFFDTTAAHSALHNCDHDYHTDFHDDLVYERLTESTARGESEYTTPTTEAKTEIDIVLAAEYLRNAADDLSRLTGRGDGVSSGADVEDVLGVVFEK